MYKIHDIWFWRQLKIVYNFVIDIVVTYNVSVCYHYYIGCCYDMSLLLS